MSRALLGRPPLCRTGHLRFELVLGLQASSSVELEPGQTSMIRALFEPAVAAAAGVALSAAGAQAAGDQGGERQRPTSNSR